MPTVRNVARTDAGLASELRVSVMRLRRRLIVEGLPDDAFERVQPPSMTRTVKLLETGGYLTRRAHDTDGRQVVVSLTDHGRDLVRADRARRDAWLSRRLSELTPEQRAVLRQAAPILDDLSRKD
jgi:DNA-binding HxlR family transcriptional regulator